MDCFPSHVYLRDGDGSEAERGNWSQVYHNHQRHIALQYDSAWGNFAREMSRGDTRVIHGIASDTVWQEMTLRFIDDRIKRNPDYKEDSRTEKTALAPPREFYANDRRFIEVRESEIGCMPATAESGMRAAPVQQRSSASIAVAARSNLLNGLNGSWNAGRSLAVSPGSTSK
jgi:hypothetical protein